MNGWLRRSLVGRWRFPHGCLLVAAFTVGVAILPGGNEAMIYRREAIAGGEWWRLWTGHGVHYGWLHLVVDTGLFVIIGRVLERQRPLGFRVALVAMPVWVSAVLFYFDPDMPRYAGLSALNVGFLVFLSGINWQADWRDWFWPSILGLHVVEAVIELYAGHGMVVFDDPSVRISTLAHVAGAVFGLLWWAGVNWTARRRRHRA